MSKSFPLVLVIVCLAAITIDSGVRAQSSTLRVLFYGYVETKPRGASGIIEGDRLIDVADAPFLPRGAELSPDGKRPASANCMLSLWTEPGSLASPSRRTRRDGRRTERR